MTGTLSDRELIAGAVTEVLEEFLAARRDDLAGIGSGTGVLVEAVTPMLRRGKRIRAVLCWWGYELARAAGGELPGAGATEADGLARAAASLELLQAAALIHDDIIDNSLTRRGLPAVHADFAARHAAEGLDGDGAEFGRAAGIIIGDLCLGWHEELFSGSGLPRTHAPAVARQRNAMRTEVMAGQYLDMRIQAARRDRLDPAALRAEAWDVLTYKSAKYSVEQPLLLGAALGGADEALLSAVSAFGLPLGQAFQLRDDVLGVFGDPDVTGKPAGDDLREGKRTVLLAHALAAVTDAATEHAARALARIGAPDLRDDEVDQLREVLRQTGALARTEDEISSRYRQATQRAQDLTGFGVPEDAVTALLDIAGAIAHRSA